MKTSFLNVTSLVAASAILLSACGGGSGGDNGINGTNGLNSLVRFSDEVPGEHCPSGGTQVSTGLDVNNNGILDDDEVTSQNYFCVDIAGAFDGIVYYADQSFDGMYELRRTSSNAQNDSLIFAPFSALGSVTDLALSPNKQHIAFTAREVTTKRDLYIYTFNSGSAPVKATQLLAENETVGSFSWAPDSSRLAYRVQNTNTGIYELYSVLPNGSANARVNGDLVANGSVTSSFEWSPLSTRIAYRADQDTDGVIELYSSLPDGTGNTKLNPALVAGGNVTNFQWAPDGSRIAYRADKTVDNQFELYSTLPNDTNSAQLNASMVIGGDISSNYRWAPDSSRIAYRADQDTDGVTELYTSLPNGTSNVKISGTMVAGGNVNYLDWVSDSSAVVYTADQEVDGQMELFLSAPSTSDGNQKINQPLVAGGNITSVFLAPDGNNLAYRANQDIDDTFELYLVSLLSLAVTKAHPDLNDGAVVYGAQWAPDGSQIAILSDANDLSVYELFITQADGTNHRQINPTAPKNAIFQIEWAPDSSRIGYIGDFISNESFELYTAAPDGSDTVKVSGKLISGGQVLYFTW